MIGKFGAQGFEHAAYRITTKLPLRKKGTGVSKIHPKAQTGSSLS